jgi:MATE family multidrug resistance protein
MKRDSAKTLGSESISEFDSNQSCLHFSSKQKRYRPGGVRDILVIALPMFISQALDTGMIFVDRLFLARLNPELMNAAMGGGLTVFMMMSFFLGLTSYTTAMVAQYLGAGRKQMCGLVLTQAVIFSLFAYVPILLGRPFAYWLFDVMGVSTSQIIPQKIYFNILIYGALISLWRTNLSCFFSGIGRTRVVTVASFIAMIVNVVSNYSLIYGKWGLPAMGIRGAAFGTLAGGFTALVVLLFAYLRKKNVSEFGLKNSFRFDPIVFKKLLKFGSSTGCEMFLNILAFNAMVLVFHSQGLVTATAATIVFNWDMVSFVPLLGVEISVTSLVGRFMGGRSPEIAHQSVLSGLKVACVYSFVIMILFIFFTDLLVGVFRPLQADGIFDQAFPISVFMLRVACLYVLAEAVFVVFIGALRGAGDTFWAMIMSVSMHWFMLLIAVFVLRVMHLPPEIGWAVMVVSFIFFTFLVFLRYKSGRWKSIVVIEPETPVILTDGFHETLDF